MRYLEKIDQEVFEMSATQLEKVLTPGQYCAWRGITKGAAAQERYKGTGPKFVKAGKSVLYRVSDVNDWLDQQTRERT